MSELVAEVVDSVDVVTTEEWNRLNPGRNPFVRHEFLTALERHHCVGPDAGWIPHHVLIRRDGALVGAMPVYVKTHSYGEFVFDWAWADAYHRNGLDYYPKLIVAAPFTPATGPRLLVEPGEFADEIKGLLIDVGIEVAKRLEVVALFETP